MKLTGQQVKQIHDAILDAYTPESLRMMVRVQMDESLHSIAGGATLSDQVFTLIEWAEKHGRLIELVKGAQEFISGNESLRAVYRDLLVWIASRPIDFDWVTVETGSFMMGSDKSRDTHAQDGELPQHSVYLTEYRIARVPVTNLQYKKFVDDTSYRQPFHWRNGQIPPDKDRHPVTNVSWHDAQAFCRWARVRLPTEAEWEKAARGTDGCIYPWGYDPRPDRRRCNFGDPSGDTTPVGSYPTGASPYGALDMAGNVWEWTSSLHRAYPYDPSDGREIPESHERRVLHGGSYDSGADWVRCALRYWMFPVGSHKNIGFRVATAEP